MGSTAARFRVPGEDQSAGTSIYDRLKQTCPLRENPDVPDRYDSERIMKFTTEYGSQTNELLIRDRQIEYNVRMVCGQQWVVYQPNYGKYIDTEQWLTDDERAWRQLPVINKLIRWYILTHARLTENPPILTWLPGPDRIDAELAEVLDTLQKKDWRDASMDDVHDRLMKWVVVSGESYAISRLDLNKGEWKPWLAEERIPIVGMDGEPIMGPEGIEFTPNPVPNVPLSYDGSPNVAMRVDGQIIPLGDGKPHMARAGGISVDVYSPLQIRGQWGPTPWHQKQWHCVQRFLTPEEVFETWGVEVEPDLSEQSAANVATLERILYGPGFYGNAAGRVGAGWGDSTVKGPLCTVYQRWQAPLAFNPKLVGTWQEPMMETPNHPGGRESVWTPRKMIRDGARAVAWPNTSPIRRFAFVDIPGRPTALSPLETLNGPQRAYNKSRSQLMEHAALLGSPQIMIDEEAGLQPNQVTNEPNKIYTVTKREGVKAIEYVVAPPVTADVMNSIKFASEEIDDLGGLQGTEGTPPTQNASGELVKELRFNSDRLLGAVARRNVAEYARMADDWRALYPLIYDEQTVIAINGMDNLATTVTVYPMLFSEGHVNVTPDAESMLPEGRGERQQRAIVLWQQNAFGPKDSPQAIDIFLEQARFPNYSRLSRPGGVDRVTAEQENGKILTGQLEQPVLPWYDHQVHLTVHEKYMKSPEFLKQPKIVQQAFAFHRMLHIIELQKIVQQQMAMGAAAMPGDELPPGGGGGPAPRRIGAPQGDSRSAVRAGEGSPPQSVQADGGRAPTAPSRPQG